MRWLLLLLLLVGLTGCGTDVIEVDSLPPLPPTPTGAAASSGVLARVTATYQGDPAAGWDSPDQWRASWRSACSIFALYAVLRAYGVQTRPGLIEDTLVASGAYVIGGGLQDLNTYAADVSHLAPGYAGEAFWHLTLAHLQQIVAAGLPVQVNIVDPTGRYYDFQAGHWLVVVGSTQEGYRVVDSSGFLHRYEGLTFLSTEQFTYLYTQRAVVVHPTQEVVP